MTQYLSVAFEVALLAGAVLAQYLLTLLFRSPGKPRWLDIELVALITAVMLTGWLAAAVGALTAGLMLIGMHYSLAFPAALILWLLISIVLWFMIDMGARLRSRARGGPPVALRSDLSEGHELGATPGTLMSAS